MERVLVIKLSALGDFVLAFGPFQAIRAAHPGARIVLLTTAPYAGFARASGLFDEVWEDSRPTLLNLPGLLALRRRLRGGRFDRVYDLQTSDRSSWYFRLMGPGRRPEWSGIAPACSHPHANPGRDDMHTLDRQREQLAMAGIGPVPDPDFSWVSADIDRFGIAAPFVLVVPGGAEHRPGKRWPAVRYVELMNRLAAKGATPVVIGAEAERGLLRTIVDGCPAAKSLIGATNFADIAVLARAAAGAVGNDTGPMHLIAASGCPTVVLFSADSDPSLCAPRGAAVSILRRDELASLTVAEVAAALSLR